MANGTYDSRSRDISGFYLKIIAIVTMAIDHIGAVIIEGVMQEHDTPALTVSDAVFRCIGRLAFPLFCFFIVEGFHYTRSRSKYAIRLLIFALASEIPFDLAFNGRILERYDNNVGFTLLLGMLSIWALDFLRERIRQKEVSEEKGNLLFAISIFLVILIVIIAEKFIASDYGSFGVIAIIILYLMKDHKLIGFSLAVIWLGFTCGNIEFFAIADLLPLYYYHGRQGRKLKYLFYIFYPAHLLALAAIARYCGIPAVR